MAQRTGRRWVDDRRGIGEGKGSTLALRARGAMQQVHCLAAERFEANRDRYMLVKCELTAFEPEARNPTGATLPREPGFLNPCRLTDPASTTRAGSQSSEGAAAGTFSVRSGSYPGRRH